MDAGTESRRVADRVTPPVPHASEEEVGRSWEPVREITERKRAAEELREWEGQYRSIFEATSDGLVIRDLDGRIVEANPAMCRMHGYSRDEFVELAPLQFIHPDYHHQVAQCLAKVRAGEEFRSQWVNLRKDGTPLHVEVQAIGFTYRERPHILSTVRDITERVEAYEVLDQRARERAEAISRRMRELEGLYRADEVLYRSLRLDQVLQALVDVVTDIMQAD